MSKKVVILGAGPAGLTLAMNLLRRSDLDVDVIVIEQEPFVGGITASFEYEGLVFDYGSHRLHPAAAPYILRDIRALLGSDLLDRPRNGRIRISGRFVKFPLDPVNLALHLPPSFLFDVLRDTLTKPFRRRHRKHGSFADVLLDGLGPTVCNTFYFPYARKLWGLEPDKIAAEQAKRRVSANRMSKILGKALGVIPGLKPEGAGRFFYPRKGFGQISRALAREVTRLGGSIQLSAEVEQIFLQNSRQGSVVTVSVKTPRDGGREHPRPYKEDIPADFIFSTIPVNVLTKILRPEPPLEIRESCKKLQYRGMVLHYIVLETDRFTPYDAHYFPEAEVFFSRLSEPKNYSDVKEPFGLTGLCAEIPCNVGDETWEAPEKGITAMVIENLKRVGLPVQYHIKASFVRRLPYIYPVYDLDFEKEFRAVDGFLQRIDGLVTLGRQGLFVHDNTHHAMETAYRASECLQPDLTWDAEKWLFYRREFIKHVVVD